ncbi:lipase class 3 family protein [Macrolepiota fuliginosa MF-IS2]|uniref:Lipase class 3 family protein n=1 Tax=Macrolepiota fuliginosa MF-IS2 TaxID=1400762 RepID=A0A9P5X6J8_9AGAR|nr:lipase class 3 family protein [Macrolepiota fuliginosa MF-IS2]
MLSRTLLATFLAVISAGASPVQFSKRQSITALTSAQISAFTPFTHFASTGYCNPSVTLTWTCGANCNANPDFIPVASGGDGSSVQFWYVGFSPSQASVIVAHQGTDPSQIEALATDADAFQESLDPSLFPGVSSSVEAHSGFAGEQAKTATQILSAVQTAIAQHSATHVTIVGHSLGAAIALLDGIYLPLHISGVTFRTIGYGTPRVGNQAFADYVDSHISFTHINNREDPVPTVPGRFLGYHHPSGEVHIDDSGAWLSCPGQDNTSTQCIVGDVPNIFDGNVSDHGGPYNGITMGC